MGLVTCGLMNKQVAGEIGISETTVKIHRGSVMRKMHAKSLADLVLMAESLGICGRDVKRASAPDRSTLSSTQVLFPGQRLRATISRRYTPDVEIGPSPAGNGTDRWEKFR
jgi:hypothetical protein